MRRFTSGEKFSALLLRDDGSLIADATRSGIWGTPPGGGKFVRLMATISPRYVRLFREFLILSYGGQSSVMWLGEVPIEAAEPLGRPPNKTAEYSYPKSWPPLMSVAQPYHLLPSGLPHVLYHYSRNQSVELLDFQTQTRRIGHLSPTFSLQDWFNMKPMLDGTAWLFVRPGQRSWSYNIQISKPCVLAIRFRMEANEQFLCAGWKRAVVQNSYGFSVVNIDDGKKICTIDSSNGSPFPQVVALPGLERVLTVNRERTVTLWDVNDGRAVTTWDWNVGRPLALAVSPSGMMAAVAGNNHHVVIWDLEG
jgi:WD40 repeat protein